LNRKIGLLPVMLRHITMNKPRLKLKFVGCEVLHREACYLAATSPHQVDVQFLRKGLHDLPAADMKPQVQAAIDAVDPQAGYDAIILGYARCNDGLVGIHAGGAGRPAVVIPRAHSCIAFFFGSAGAYREYFDEHPGTYYMTTGWAERDSQAGGIFQNFQHAQGESDKSAGLAGPADQGVLAKLGLTDSYEQMVEKYGRDNADFIMESLGDWTKNYRQMLYLQMFPQEVCDETPYIDQARKQACQHSWQFEVRPGKWDILRKLFWGQWDDDFVILQAGQSLTARNDDRILDKQG
jgi:hypothetical protein